MKFCSNCGCQMEDSVKFCGSCGAVQEDANAQENFAYGQPEAAQAGGSNNGFDAIMEKGKQLTNGKVWLIPVAAVAAIFVIWFVIFFFTSIIGSGSVTKKGAVKAYYEALAERDGKAYVNATMSPSMLKAVLESGDYDNKKELIEELDEEYEEEAEDYEDWYDTKLKVKYKNIEIEDMDKCDKDDIEDVVDYIEDYSDVKVKISQMYEVEVSYKKWNNYNEEWDKVEDEIIIYKSAGNWYVFE